MTTTTDYSTLEICVDCLMLLANGEVNEWQGTEYVDITIEHTAKMRAIWGATHISLGRTREEWYEDHREDCHKCGDKMRYWYTSKVEPGLHLICDCGAMLFRLSDEDDTDEPFFSHRDCQGCGSTLGGDREYATAWIEENK